MRRAQSRVAGAGVAIAIFGLSGLAVAGPAAANPTTGAAFTTVNESMDGPGHCQNGSPDTNCNIYDDKQHVWMNGGPLPAQVGDGTYFFAVLAPGGQPGPNDGDDGNLSDDYDGYTNRTFTISDGTVSYGGTHTFDANKIRLADYADTPNPGGVYSMAICSLAKGYPVSPRDCKYDAFKVLAGAAPAPGPLSVTKDASGGFDTKYTWQIGKSVDKTLVEQIGGSATFTYTVVATRDAGVAQNYHVTGTIEVTNPNTDADGTVVPVSGVSLVDTLSDGTACVVTDGGGQPVAAATLTTFTTAFSYTCDDSTATSGASSNTVTVAWPAQGLSIGDLPAGSANFTFAPIPYAENLVDECVTVTDSVTGGLGTACGTTTYTYARTVAMPQYDCQVYNNTATFTTNDTAATGSAGRSVKACGPARTGALTMGFWQNKNGQGIVTSGASTGGVCNSGTWLRGYAPFADLSATATCAQVGTYVTNVVKAANASGASMNSMLKAQSLATALDVYFSDPSLGGNKIGAPRPIGGVTIDLTKVCHMVDGTGAVATCGGTLRDVSSAFGGATSLTITQLLGYAAGQSTAGGSLWYGNVKATQELAKDAFDAINNQVVFAP